MRFTMCFILLSGALSILTSCASTGRSSNIEITENIIEPTKENISYLNLGEYLKRVPGINVQKNGTDYEINIRSTFRLSGSTEPLFVVNKVPLASYNQAAAVVDPMEIDRVEVIRDVAGSNAYGMRGANGVIVIFLKN